MSATSTPRERRSSTCSAPKSSPTGPTTWTSLKKLAASAKCTAEPPSIRSRSPNGVRTESNAIEPTTVSDTAAILSRGGGGGGGACRRRRGDSVLGRHGCGCKGEAGSGKGGRPGLPRDRRLRVSLRLPYRGPGRLRRHDRVVVPTAVRLAERLRRNAGSGRGRVPYGPPWSAGPRGAPLRARNQRAGDELDDRERLV